MGKIKMELLGRKQRRNGGFALQREDQTHHEKIGGIADVADNRGLGEPGFFCIMQQLF